MGEVAQAAHVIEPADWYVVFHRKSLNPILSYLAFGEFKHVSAFGYLPGVKMWLVYDANWGGMRIMLMDRTALIAWTDDCEILRTKRAGHMGWSARLGLYCVSSIKHLIGLRCVAATPSQLYRHILRNGGVDIGASRPAARTAP